MSMQFFALTGNGPQPLPIPAGAVTFEDLLGGYPLGVYSVLRTFNHNHFLHLDYHLARTAESMALLGWHYAWDQTRLRHALHTLTSAAPFAEMRVRWDILAAAVPLAGTDSREVVALQAFTPPPAAYYEQGVAVDYAPQLHRQNPLAKTADFAVARQVYPIGTAEAYERLLVDENGRILECTGANFYAIRDGTLYTAGEGVLAGVTRRIILQLAAELRLPVRLEPVAAADVATLDEAALSSSSRGLMPVVKIGGQVVGNGRPGPICQQIMAAYNQFVQAAIQPAIIGAA